MINLQLDSIKEFGLLLADKQKNHQPTKQLNQLENSQQQIQFQQFIKGIKSQYLDQLNVNNQNHQHQKLLTNQTKSLMQPPNQSGNIFKQNSEKSSISALSSIENHSSDQALGQQVSNQQIKRFLQNQEKIENYKSEKIGSQEQYDSQMRYVTQSQQFLNHNPNQLAEKFQQHDQDQQQIPFEAGFGNFLKEMEKWTRDASFQDEIHDIWKQSIDSQSKPLQKQNEVAESEVDDQFLKLNYITDFSQSTFGFDQTKSQRLINKIQQISAPFIFQYKQTKKQTQLQWLLKLQQLIALGKKLKETYPDR